MIRLLFALLFLHGFTYAQNVQWASRVNSFSSEFKYEKYPGQYEAKEILGEPSVFKKYDANPCAWSPKMESNAEGEFIHVGFDNPQFAQQVLIHETFNGGAIRKVIVNGVNGEEKIVFEKNEFEKVGEVRLFSVKFPRTTFKVAGVRVELQTDRVAGFNQIDAIGIVDSPNEFSVKINVNPLVEKEVVEIKNLGDRINSSTDDLSPVISPNGKTLYYTRQNHPNNVAPISNQDIWKSEMDDSGSFQTATNVGEPLNNTDNNSALGITPDGQQMLLLNIYSTDGNSGKGISIAKRNATGWGYPEKVVIDDYYNNSAYGEYCLSNSGTILVMTIMFEGTEGNKDLYVSFKKDDGTWTKPKSLGATVNTAASEISPFLAADDRTLYFSSSGHPGYGGSDIFVTRRLDDSWQNWSKPENLGPYLNSDQFDAYYTLPAKGDRVYFVSYREGSLGGSDIFTAPVPVSLRPDPVALVKGRVLDKKSGEPLVASIAYHALSSGNKIGEGKSDPSNGQYEVVLPSGEKYGFFAKKDGYLPVSQEFELKKTDGYQEKQVDLYMVKIEKDAVIVLNNLYFDTGKFALRKESYVELKEMIAILNANPTMKVEISGHTDDVGDNASNMTLSNNRAKAVVNYLTSNGIAAERLISIGYGETKPVVAKFDAASRQLNRRVEFKITDL